MWEAILKVLSVYFSCMLKFILGPIGGYASGLHMVTTILTTVFGMMTVVVVFTYSGNYLREKAQQRFTRKYHPSSPGGKRLAAFWKKYGLGGIAMLTPLLLTPIGGTLLAVSSGSPKEKIIFYMFVSASAWSVLFSWTIYAFGNEVVKMLPEIIKP